VFISCKPVPPGVPGPFQRPRPARIDGNRPPWCEQCGSPLRNIAFILERGAITHPEQNLVRHDGRLPTPTSPEPGIKQFWKLDGDHRSLYRSAHAAPAGGRVDTAGGPIHESPQGWRTGRRVWILAQ